ncbi:MAG: alpha-hydroxy-acid oxidizing protein [Desulfurispora sp.]|uniref:alpha-hydroxy-acid oxidizing protein n=1 Tax=Desulfurispora sp. TaxID=3014275 RepID=UPI004048F125
MDIHEIRKLARERMKGYCAVCPVCNGKACAGQVPGMGGTGSGAAFQNNLSALAKYRLHLRTVHNVTAPETSCNILGLELTTPVLAAPMTGVSYNMGGALTESQFISQIMAGAREAGSIGCCGDGGDPQFFDAGLAAIREQGGHGIAFIKPRSQEEVKKRLRLAEEAGARAVGIDIDGAGLVTMALFGQPVGPKTAEELRELVHSTSLPFIVKGIMTVDEARLAAGAGAAAIVVSNHGGRILDHTPGAAEVLPAIAEAVGQQTTVLADGGVRSGVDVLKLLALGAKAVLVGRPLAVAAVGGGTEGVRLYLEKYTAELKQAMILTGCARLSDIGPHILA